MALDSQDVNLIKREGSETRKELSNITKELVLINKTLVQILDEIRKTNKPKNHIGPG